VRTLAAALTAAQRQPVRQPYIEVLIKDRHANIRRLRPNQWRNGAETIGPHAAAVPTDGSLNRFRIDGTTLYRQRVTTPTSGSDYSIWTSFRTGTRLVAASQTGATIDVFAVDDAAPTTIYRATSSDNGATWGAFALAITNPVTVSSIAAAAKSTTEIVVLTNNTANTRAWRLAAGVWDPFDTADGALTPTGLAAVYSGDYNCVITGTDPVTLASRVATRIFGDGISQANDTWGSPMTLTEAQAPAQITHSDPTISRISTYRIMYREVYAGTNAYQRLYFTNSPATADFANDLWREPTPYNLAESFGLAMSNDNTNLFLTSARRVHQQLVADPAILDVTADVLAYEHHDEPFSRRQAKLTLDNSRDTYNNNPMPTPLTIGAQVSIALGYVDLAATPPVNLSVAAHVLQIAAWTVDTGSPKTTVLTLNTPFNELHNWRTTRVRANPPAVRSIFNQLARIAAAAGYEFSSIGGSPELSNLMPATTITPGESLATAIARLMDRLPDVIFTRNEFLTVNEPLAGDGTDEKYGFPHLPAAGHELTSGQYSEAAPPTAHVRVAAGAAATTLADSIDYIHAPLTPTGPLIIVDRELTAAEAADRAGNTARKSAIAAHRHTITAPVHCGIEINDVLQISDVRYVIAQPGSQRVTAITTHYRRRRDRPPAYHQTIALADR